MWSVWIIWYHSWLRCLPATSVPRWCSDILSDDSPQCWVSWWLQTNSKPSWESPSWWRLTRWRSWLWTGASPGWRWWTADWSPRRSCSWWLSRGGLAPRKSSAGGARFGRIFRTEYSCDCSRTCLWWWWSEKFKSIFYLFKKQIFSFILQTRL